LAAALISGLNLDEMAFDGMMKFPEESLAVLALYPSTSRSPWYRLPSGSRRREVE
jgi:hypothetical protein